MVTVIVFGLIVFLSSYTGLINITSSTSEDVRSYDSARQFKNNLLICHGHTRLFESKLHEEGSCNIPYDIHGYEVEQIERKDCDEKIWSEGEIDLVESQVIPYQVLVVQQSDASTCIANLKIYI